MFYHAYRAYMDNAFPADELQPLSCKGRIRGVSPSRGDMDDILGKLVSNMEELNLSTKQKNSLDAAFSFVFFLFIFFNFVMRKLIDSSCSTY